MKEIFIDTETTGIDPKLNGVIQIAGIIRIDGMEKERFNLKGQPVVGKVLEQQALEKIKGGGEIADK